MKFLFLPYLFIALLSVSHLACKGLKEDEIAIVKFSLSGDFGGQECQVKIYTERNQIKGRLECLNDTTLTTTLTHEQISQFNDFIDELKNVTTGVNCTTDISCIAITHKGTISQRNIDCNWSGFFRLKRELFGISG